MKFFASILLLFLSLTLLPGQQAGEGMNGLIGPSDSVSITVHREPDLNASGQLAKDGSISIPLIGTVRLSGKTTAIAETLIEAKFRDGYLVRPEVSVLITKRVERTVTVNGHVTSPGVFNLPHDRKITLRQVIGMAGGATDIANLKKVTLRRGVNGKAYTINLKDIMANKAKDIVLQQDDFIHVPEGWF